MKFLVLPLLLLSFFVDASSANGVEGNVEVAKVCGKVRDFILETGAVVATSPGGNDLFEYEQRFVKAWDDIYLFDLIRGNAADEVMDAATTGFGALDKEVRNCLEQGTCDASQINLWSNDLAMNLHYACKRDFRGQP